jgi:hypothetical protein
MQGEPCHPMLYSLDADRIFKNKLQEKTYRLGRVSERGGLSHDGLDYPKEMYPVHEAPITVAARSRV